MIDPDDLVAEVRGEVEKDGKVLVLRRVHVRYLLRASRSLADVIERVREVHAASCPVARSLDGCVAVRTEVVLRD